VKEGRQEVFEGFKKDVFPSPGSQLGGSFEAEDILHQGIIEKRDAYLQGVGHAHAVHLGEHVAGKQSFDIQIEHEVDPVFREKPLFLFHGLPDEVQIEIPVRRASQELPSHGEREYFPPSAKALGKGETHSSQEFLRPSDQLETRLVPCVRKALDEGCDHVLSKDAGDPGVMFGPVLAQVHPVTGKELVSSVARKGHGHVALCFPGHNVGGNSGGIGKRFVEMIKDLGKGIQDILVTQLELIVFRAVECCNFPGIPRLVKGREILVSNGEGLHRTA